MPSIFTKIIRREIPAYIVAEDDHHIAFLDINPIAVGHVLAVPKREVDYIFSMDDAELAALMAFVKRVALGVEKVIPCERVGMAVVGLEVPHVHVHIVPLREMADMDFSKRVKLTEQEFAAIADAIREAVGAA